MTNQEIIITRLINGADAQTTLDLLINEVLIVQCNTI